MKKLIKTYKYLVYYWSDNGKLQQIPATIEFYDNSDILETIIKEINIDKLDSEIKLETALDDVYKDSIDTLKDYSKNCSKIKIIYKNKLLRETVISEFKLYHNKELDKAVLNNLPKDYILKAIDIEFYKDRYGIELTNEEILEEINNKLKGNE